MTTKKATDPVAPAMVVGEELLSGFRQELTDLKNPKNNKQNVWQMLSEAKQDEILDRFGRRIANTLRVAFEAILAGGVPAVHARLANVAFSAEKIKASIEIPRSSEHRHELADFAGQEVLVILTDNLDAYLESMASVKPDKDQAELELAGGTGKLVEEMDDDPRTLQELKDDAGDLAVEIGEDEITTEMATWERGKLIDYINFASGVKEKNQPASGSNGGSK